MIKSILYVSLALCAIVASSLSDAAPIKEDEEVRQASKEAFQRGINFFGNGIIKERQEAAREAPKIPKHHSFYTSGIESPSGGKPAIVEQYRKHSYMPIAPSVLPPKFPKTANGKFNAEQAAQVFRPQAPYQIRTDRLFIP